MLPPFGRRDLVLDQFVHGLGVGHAQQGLGQTHQRHALFGRKTVFGQKHFHHARLAVGPDRADQIGGTGGDADAGRFIGSKVAHQSGDQLFFVAQMQFADRLTDVVKLDHVAFL